MRTLSGEEAPLRQRSSRCDRTPDAIFDNQPEKGMSSWSHLLSRGEVQGRDALMRPASCPIDRQILPDVMPKTRFGELVTPNLCEDFAFISYLR